MGKTAIVITLPKKISWEEYKKEIAAVADGDYEMNFRVSTYPKKVSVGDRCYICHNNKLIGWMTISNIGRKSGFECTTTGDTYDDGFYISRSGKFHYLERPVEMKGFRGFRYIEEID